MLINPPFYIKTIRQIIVYLDDWGWYNIPSDYVIYFIGENLKLIEFSLRKEANIVVSSNSDTLFNRIINMRNITKIEVQFNNDTSEDFWVLFNNWKGVDFDENTQEYYFKINLDQISYIDICGNLVVSINNT